MRIGVTCYPTYGGSGIVATELGLELAARGHEIHFITYASPIRMGSGAERIHYHEVEVSSYPLFQYPPYCLALASRMADVAETQRLDLLHVHYAIPHSIAAMLAQQMMAGTRRIPFVTTLHGTDITLVGTDPSYFPITRFSIEKSDGVTSISDYLCARTHVVFGVERHIRVIRNFVNCRLYRPPAEPPKEPTLLHVSNFRPVKRIQDCIRILARVRKDVPARLLMAGDGPERSSAERLARDLGVCEHVRFLGKQDHVERLFPQAHILLMPSELESFGLAALEAMACGVVPIATNAGGVPELITNWEDGFLEAVGDVENQAQRVIEVLTNEKEHLRLSQAARLKAENHFDTLRVIPQYEAFYEEVLRS
ncbi:MAG: N-acetyl-alpha-D-glucosaminyl L-malate synthase BshA [Acidobacteria bacterium]|nr:N-acetyl-alpha-D-glucosaminyl L-malate synthase BshA [Acidobacteriota bacterium]